MEINNENQNKKRLGRGLNSLFAEAKPETIDYSKSANQAKQTSEPIAPPQKAVATDIDPELRIWKIAIDKIVPGVYQPRKTFNKEAISELAESIKQNGIIQPITVRKRKAGGFEIIAGERRWRAAPAAGLHEISAIIKSIGDQEALQLAIIENVQREDLDAIEEAEGYHRLMTEFGFSQQQVSEKVGKERSSVANALRLLGLPQEIKEFITEKLLSVGHAKALLSVADKAIQIKLAKESIAKNLSVRALEHEIKSKTKATGEESNPKGIDIDVASKLAYELADQIQKKLGTKTEINYKSGKGQVILHFYSDDQLTQIYEKLNI